MSSNRKLALWWGGVALALVVAAPLAAALIVALPGCPLKQLTEIPCPACGSGRAMMALSDGDMQRAFGLNPAATGAAILFVGAGLAVGGAAAFGKEPPGLGRELPVWLRVALPAALMANWVYVWRIAAI